MRPQHAKRCPKPESGRHAQTHNSHDVEFYYLLHFTLKPHIAIVVRSACTTYTSRPWPPHTGSDSPQLLNLIPDILKRADLDVRQECISKAVRHPLSRFRKEQAREIPSMQPHCRCPSNGSYISLDSHAILKPKIPHALPAEPSISNVQHRQLWARCCRMHSAPAPCQIVSEVPLSGGFLR